MKLRYCLYLTSTPDFTDIANLEELILEGCKNLVKVHPSVGMLKKLVVLNLKDCTRVRSFPSKVEMDSLQVLNLSGCLKVDKLPEDLVKIKSLTELHADRNAITELPSFVSSLTNLESLSIGGQGRVQPRWWTSITSPFGLLSKQQHPQRSIPSLASLYMLKGLNFSYCNLEKVPESIGGLSCLKELNLKGNNFSSLSGSLSQLSSLKYLWVDGCKKLEVLPKLPPSLSIISACDCTSLCAITSFKYPIMMNLHSYLHNCPKLFSNIDIDSQLSISENRCLDSSITAQGFTNQLSSFLEYAGIQNNRGESFRFLGSSILNVDIKYSYDGNSSILEWFTNRSTENHVKVELPSDWCVNKFRGYGTCVVIKRKDPSYLYEECSIKNFNGASLGWVSGRRNYFEGKPRFLCSHMIWLHYTRVETGEWKEAKNFETFSFFEEFQDREQVELKECGVRLIYDEDLEQEAYLSMLHGLPTPKGHGVARIGNTVEWSWH